jgi:hypothetical protein
MRAADGGGAGLADVERRSGGAGPRSCDARYRRCTLHLPALPPARAGGGHQRRHGACGCESVERRAGKCRMGADEDAAARRAAPFPACCTPVCASERQNAATGGAGEPSCCACLVGERAEEAPSPVRHIASWRSHHIASGAEAEKRRGMERRSGEGPTPGVQAAPAVVGLPCSRELPLPWQALARRLCQSGVRGQ